MKNLIKYICFIILLFSNYKCTNDEATTSPNAIYFEGTTGTNIANISIDKGGTQIPISIRSAKPMDTEAKITTRLDQEALEQYNKENGSSYKMLPVEYYTFSNNSFTIEKGMYISGTSPLSVKDISDLPEIDKYALAITIIKTEGSTPVMNSSKTYFILIDRVLYTTVAELTGGSIKAKYQTPYKSLRNWTMEWRAKVRDLNSNNQTLLYSYPTEVYTRFGDVVIQPDQLQVKIAGSQFSPQQNFIANRWYHFALVYNGTSVIWYIDGAPVMNSTLSASFDFTEIGFGGDNISQQQQVNEIRFWNIIRSPADIRNNMYTIDPSTPGLEGYWKCNDGAGNIIKDYSKNGNNMTASPGVEWIQDVRMPAE
ncbi:BT_3987 domain-containing protein [Elizabethkingia anophelis]|uniref:BT_3987 domain-containing protein n=1 Tax=Elizabethkingia anophelis TaxID=1117645 RepID=UPI003557AA51